MDKLPDGSSSSAAPKAAVAFLDTHGRSFAASPLPPALLSLGALSYLPARPPALFAAAFAASALMNYDGYTVDGAGTSAVWSGLWLAYQRRTEGGLVRRVWRGATGGVRGLRGLGVGALAFGQMVGGGWYWLRTGRPAGAA